MRKEKKVFAAILKEAICVVAKGRTKQKFFFFSLIRLLSFLYITVHNQTGIPYLNKTSPYNDDL